MSMSRGDLGRRQLCPTPSCRFLWTPELLWAGHGAFLGLQEAVLGCEATRVDVVLSQCYGKHFADRLDPLIPEELRERVFVHGLSYGKTKRQPLRKISFKGENWTLSVRVWHVQLVKWFAQNFPR